MKEKEEFNAIIREKQKYERMKQNVKNIIEKQENMRLNSMISKNMTSFSTCDSLKIKKHFTKSKKIYFPFLSYCFFFIFCMYKAYLMLVEGYKNAGVHILIIKKTGKIWVSVKNVHNGLGVKNISDLVLKEIYGIYKTKNLTNKQVQK